MTITLTMDDRQLSTMQEVERFTAGTAGIEFCGASRKEKYAWVEATLIRFRYARCRKKDRSAIKRFVGTVTGYSAVQMKRLIQQHPRTGKVLVSAKRKHRFATTYTTDDVALLAQTDNAHQRL